MLLFDQEFLLKPAIFLNIPNDPTLGNAPSIIFCKGTIHQNYNKDNASYGFIG